MARIGNVGVEVLADPHNPQLLVRVTAEDGVTGIGETWWGTYQPGAPAGMPVLPIAAALLRAVTDDDPLPADGVVHAWVVMRDGRGGTAVRAFALPVE